MTSDPQRAVFRSALDGLIDRVSRVLDELGPSFPMFIDNDGKWYTTEDGNWCAGHWIGLLWLSYSHAPDESAGVRFKDAAYLCIEQLRRQPKGHIFAGMNHNYGGFFGSLVIEDPELLRLGMQGADAMLDLFEPVGQLIPVGFCDVLPRNGPNENDSSDSEWSAMDLGHTMAVDTIHTSLPVLWRAYALSEDSRYLEAARAHLRRHLDWMVRPDGSTIQLRAYEKSTGVPGPPLELLAPGGCWSRGFGWHVNGLCEAILATRDLELVHCLRLSMRYYLAQVGSDLLPAWDLALGEAAQPIDASAAAATAYGLVRLADSSDHRLGDLVVLGEKILTAVVERCIGTEDGPLRGAVQHGCYRFPSHLAIDTELIWSDFYTAAALSHVLKFNDSDRGKSLD